MGIKKLILVRHGQSIANVARSAARKAGESRFDIGMRDADAPLTDKGRDQAAAVGRWLASLPARQRPNVIIVSPFLRTRQTAEVVIAASGMDPKSFQWVIDERLREHNSGELVHMTERGMSILYPDEVRRLMRDGKFYYQPPRGESYCDVTFRLRSLLADVERRYPGKRVAFFAHQIVIECARYILEELSEEELMEIDAQVPPVHNGSVTSYKADAKTGKLTPELINFIPPTAPEPTA